MKKKIYGVIGFVVLLTGCFGTAIISEAYSGPDVSENGYVCSFYTYTTYQDGEETVYYHDYSYTYDANGYEVEKFDYYESFAIGKWPTTYYYEYDEAGNLISRSDTDGDSYTYEYEYDEAGNLVKKVVKGDDIEYETTFDSDGRESTYVIYYNGSLYSSTEYSYNEDGLLTEEDYGSAGSKEYEYDENGVCTGTVTYNSSGAVTKSEVYEYDSEGNRTKVTACDADGEITSIGEYEYQTAG